ncbi:LPXTG cell wall anchor domain-containing protein [Kribbella sp. NPDC051770]|uniref:LPXTG cell wall anchor domain-containing protein n=1 Tax=Kribbella sp. NPDC051770 TaxID=3155413 RepID=UPI0034289DC7
MSGWKRVPAIAVLAAGLAAASVTPAAAHPFGDPQTVTVALARPDVVRVHWKVGGLDDLTLLGIALELLPRDRVMLDGAVFFRPSDAAAVGPSGKFADYLLRQISVTSGDARCVGKVQPVKDVAKAGAIVDYTCTGPVGKALVDVRTLTDLNPAYQTLATGPAGERAVYGSDRTTHEWLLGDVPAEQQQVAVQTGRSAAIQLSAVIGGVVLAAAAALFVVRRRKAIA